MVGPAATTSSTANGRQRSRGRALRRDQPRSSLRLAGCLRCRKHPALRKERAGHNREARNEAVHRGEQHRGEDGELASIAVSDKPNRGHGDVGGLDAEGPEPWDSAGLRNPGREPAQNQDLEQAVADQGMCEEVRLSRQ